MGYHHPAERFDAACQTDGAALSAPRAFTVAECEALFAAILIDDEVDAHTELPATIRSDYPQHELLDCFGLALQLWETGFDRRFLVRIAGRLFRRGDLDTEDRRAFKHVRAKFKHLRYAHLLYGARDDYPRLLDHITVTMGHLQDAFRNRRRVATMVYAAALRVLLARPAVARIRAEATRLAPVDTAGFRAMLERDRAHLAGVLAAGRVTGRELHEARKIIGRQVSFYDTLRTLRPSPDSTRMSRSLSAINGLMGALHDELVTARATDRSAYETDRFALPAPIRTRLVALVDRRA